MIVRLQRRPLWKRLLWAPRVWLGHYRILRRNQAGRWDAARSSYRLTAILWRSTRANGHA